MHDALLGLLDKVDLAVAQSVGILPEPGLEEVARLAREARARLSYPDDVVVAALAGGTGSGKSSLLNAVAGDDVALTGGLRPMTDQPLALVPEGRATALTGLLDGLGIEHRVTHDGPGWLCLLDLPDTDSVEVDHRLQVDRLLPRIDVLVWVTDPEKYRDAALHHRYVTQLADRAGQMVFVLNQADRLDEGALEAVREDLLTALRDDGIGEPRVVVTAAAPAAGPPIGIDELLEELELLGRRRDVVNRKLLGDLARATSTLVGVGAGATALDFDVRWQRARRRAGDLAAEGDFAGAGRGVRSFLSGLGAEAGDGTRAELDRIASIAPTVLLTIVEEEGATAATSPVPGPQSLLDRLLGRHQPPPAPEPGPSLSSEAVAAGLERHLGEAIRSVLEQRARAHAAIAEVSLALHDLERRDH